MKKLCLLFAVIVLSACSTRVATLTVISNKNVNTSKVEVSKLSKEKVIGKSNKFVFIVPFGTPKLQEAVDDALSKSDNADMLVDISVYKTSWWFIIGQVGYKITASAVNTKGDK